MIDVDALLRPIDGACPAGPDLEYAGLDALDLLAEEAWEDVDPRTGEPVRARGPDWAQVGAMARELFRRTKDLRVAVWLARAELATHGLPGLCEGLHLIAVLCDRFWTTLHPRLDSALGDDPTERLNVLMNLCPALRSSQGSARSAGLLGALHAAPVAEPREEDRPTIRDLDLACGRSPAMPGLSVPSLAALERAWQQTDPGRRHALRTAVAKGQSALRDLSRLFLERSNHRPSFDRLMQTLQRVDEFHDRSDATPAESADDRAPEGLEMKASAVGDSHLSSFGGPASRLDATRILQKVSEFLRRTEPGSPAPMFIDRAIRLLGMDFSAIVRELMPESAERIELLGGVALERADPTGPA